MMNISRTTALFAAFGFLILSVLCFVFLIQPSYGTIMELRIATVKVVGDIQQKEDAVAKIQALVSKYQNLSDIRELFSKSLPSSLDSAAITGEVNVIAQRNFLAVESITYEVVPIAPLPDPKRNSKFGYGGMKLKVVVAGPYANIKGFISGLESSMRIFDVKSILFESPDELLAVQNTMKAEVVFVTYYQSNQEIVPTVRAVPTSGSGSVPRPGAL